MDDSNDLHKRFQALAAIHGWTREKLAELRSLVAQSSEPTDCGVDSPATPAHLPELLESNSLCVTGRSRKRLTRRPVFADFAVEGGERGGENMFCSPAPGCATDSLCGQLAVNDFVPPKMTSGLDFTTASATHSPLLECALVEGISGAASDDDADTMPIATLRRRVQPLASGHLSAARRVAAAAAAGAAATATTTAAAALNHHPLDDDAVHPQGDLAADITELEHRLTHLSHHGCEKGSSSDSDSDPVASRRPAAVLRGPASLQSPPAASVIISAEEVEPPRTGRLRRLRLPSPSSRRSPPSAAAAAATTLLKSNKVSKETYKPRTHSVICLSDDDDSASGDDDSLRIAGGKGNGSGSGYGTAAAAVAAADDDDCGGGYDYRDGWLVDDDDNDSDDDDDNAEECSADGSAEDVSDGSNSSGSGSDDSDADSDYSSGTASRVRGRAAPAAASKRGGGGGVIEIDIDTDDDSRGSERSRRGRGHSPEQKPKPRQPPPPPQGGGGGGGSCAPTRSGGYCDGDISASTGRVIIAEEEATAKGGSGGVRAPSAAMRTKAQRAKLTQALFEEYNRTVFRSLLPASLPIEWSARLRKTAGMTYSSMQSSAASAAAKAGSASPPSPLHIARVELSVKVLDTPAKLASTLLHELCHVAAWTVDGNRKPPHGPMFKKWAARASAAYPARAVTTCHSYEIACKFNYACVGPAGGGGGCGATWGRHSRSIDPATQRCGKCGGSIILAPHPGVVTSVGMGGGSDGELGAWADDSTAAGTGAPPPHTPRRAPQQQQPSEYQRFMSSHRKSTAAALGAAATPQAVMSAVAGKWRQRKAEAAATAAVVVAGAAATGSGSAASATEEQCASSSGDAGISADDEDAGELVILSDSPTAVTAAAVAVIVLD